MNQHCSMIRDLLPLYEEKLVQDETRRQIEAHLEDCSQCRAFYETARKELSLPVEPPTTQKEKTGMRLMRKLNSVKYFTVLFAMAIAVWNTFCTRGAMSLIPLAILLPFAVTLLFRSPIFTLSTGAVFAFLAGFITGESIVYGLLCALFFTFLSGLSALAAWTILRIKNAEAR